MAKTGRTGGAAFSFNNSTVNERRLRDLEAELRALPEQLSKRVLAGAIRAGAGVYQRAARDAAPQRTGALSASIRVTTGRRKGRTTATVRAGGIGPWGNTYYAHWVEFGTAPHKIRAWRGKALVVGGRMMESVEHPGGRAKPFMRPAFDTQTGKARQEIADVLRRTLAKAVSAQARRGRRR